MEPPSALALPALTALLLAAGVARLLARARQFGPLDEPNERSLHQRAVPRTGGLAVLAGLAGALVVLAFLDGLGSSLGWLLAALAPVALISWRDDQGHVPASVRLAVHLAAALVLWAGGLGWRWVGLPGYEATPLPWPLAAPVSWLFVVWMVNLYNFMDGMDGFAGGMAVIGFGALAVLGMSGGALDYAAVCAAVAAAAAGFLTVNFPPARLFLGDLGSASLGLLAAGLILWGAELGLFAPWVGVLAFSPFIVDATWTLVARAARREPLWRAHRCHHYQRLVLAGWSHRRTVLAAYVLMLGAAACATAAPGLSPMEQWLVLAGWAGIYVLVHLRVGLAERLAAGERRG